MKSVYKTKIIILSLGLTACAISYAAVDLSLQEFEIKLPTEPNIMFLLDDSGSMANTVTLSPTHYRTNGYFYSGMVEKNITDFDLPHILCGPTNPSGTRYWEQYWLGEPNTKFCDPYRLNFDERGMILEFHALDWRLGSSDFDSTYYNPELTYTPWQGFADLDFHDVMLEPEGDTSRKIDLGSKNFSYTRWSDTAGFTGTLSQANINQTPNGLMDIWDNFEEIIITNSGVKIQSTLFLPTPNLVDCRPDRAGNVRAQVLACFNGVTTEQTGWDGRFGRTLAQEKTNIANWFGYFRTRKRALASLVDEVVLRQPQFRYGLMTFDDYNPLPIPPTAIYDKTVHNQAVIQRAIDNPALAYTGTHTRRGLDRVANYFRSTDPATAPILDSCQQNFAVILTDGLEGYDPVPGITVGDADGDGQLTTIADVARFAYMNDLRPDLADAVSATQTACPGIPLVKHQHLRTITIPFGYGSVLTADADQCWPASPLGVADVWGKPDGRSIEGLWHASYNSAGQFIPGINYPFVADSLNLLLGKIDEGIRSASAGTVNSGRLQSGNFYYSSFYEPSSILGDIRGWQIQAGDIELGLGTPTWSAAKKIKNQDFAGANRLVLTRNPANGTTKRLTIDANVNTVLNSDQRDRVFPGLNGRALKDAYTDMATRLTNLELGAIVHSSPMAVGPPTSVFPISVPYVNDYLAFRAAHKDRPSVVYVGSNTGSLHGFMGDTGQELFAYYPDLFINADLPRLDANLISRVDGPIAVADVYFDNANKWRTILVSGLRMGGKGYFAFDITNPAGLKAGDYANTALWEFKDEDDLGLSFSKPAIGLMANDKWVAVFGNGYNSANGDATLFFVDVETGALIKKIKMGHGPSQDPLNQDRRNGLAEPALVDQDGDGRVDRIYVGDYFGNIFNVDVSGTNASQWASAYGTAALAVPLYATGGAPITSKPGVVEHPQNGLIVLFGTGQNISSSTVVNMNSVYGLYDFGSPIANSSSLQQHTMVATGRDIIIDESTLVDDPLGWRIEYSQVLKTSQIVASPKIQAGQVSFVATALQEVKDCAMSKYKSSIITLNAYTGYSVTAGTFLDEDGKVVYKAGVPVDGIISDTQYLDAIVLGNGQKEVFIAADAEGQHTIYNKAPSKNANGRRYWMRMTP